MKLLKKLFDLKDEREILRFSKSMNKWQVFQESRLVYVGDKSSCLKFIRNTKLDNWKKQELLTDYGRSAFLPLKLAAFTFSKDAKNLS